MQEREPLFDIYLDLETYSATDLKASGVYRYVTDPDFMVLMAAYAFGRDAPVKSTTDPVMIRKLAELCADPANTIWAHNANFERVALSAVLGYDVGHGELIDPGHWEDTQALAAVHGWPQSLERLAVAAGGEQKDTAGTRLINTFSKPNRKGERTLPEEKPQDWKLFLDYCVQDVVTLQDVAKFLPGWPTEGERQIWVEDQRINDRGIRVDTDMVAAAAEVADLNRIEQELEVTSITGIDNPGSTAQLSAWLRDQGVRIHNLRKETVQDILDFGGLEPEVERVLKLRQELALAASKKYMAALDRVSADGRLRGSFQYHGAHTGRWCLTGDHEVLTPSGWQRFDAWGGGPIAVWDEDHTLRFQTSNAVAFEYSGPMIHHDTSTCQQIATPDHRMPSYTSRGNFLVRTAGELQSTRHAIPVTGFLQGRGTPSLSIAETRVLVMTQADGHFTRDNILRFRLKQPRKILRCQELLQDAGIPFQVKPPTGQGDEGTSILVARRHLPRWLREFQAAGKTFSPEIWDLNGDVFFEELLHWDGSASSPNGVEYGTTNTTNADLVQAFAHLTGRTARVQVRSRPDSGWADLHRVGITTLPTTPRPRQNPAKISEVDDFSGTVYCAETSTGFFLVRRNGKVWVTGNSGRGVQLQNLPRETLDEVDGQTPDDTIAEAVMHLMVDEAGDAHTLKALVRSMFLGPMTVVDYSAIEARVVAWLAGETWALEAFEAGRDIYTETACIAQGSLVLTDHGEVPIEDVTRDMKVWDGVEWVEHDGVVYNGMRKVIHYDGLSATEDHLVWVDGAADPIPFGEAAALGRRLTRSGAGAAPSDQDGEVSVGRNRMHSVSLRGPRRGAEPSETRSPVVHSVPQRAFGAVSEISAPQTGVPVGPPELWRAGDSIQLLQHGRSRRVDVVAARHIPGEGHRPDRQQRPLRTGERPVGDPWGEYAQRPVGSAGLLGPEILAVRGGPSPSAYSPGDEPAGNYTTRPGRGSSARPVVEDRGEAVAVYDILNAGKRHRFTASGRLVHNCRMGPQYDRTDGKVATLALGYNGGVGSLMAMGAEGTPDQLQKIVWTWRAANENIVQMWRDMEDAFRHGDRWVGDHIYVERDENSRILWLPSGRGIGYHRVGQKWVTKTWPSGDTSRVRQLSFADAKIYPRRADTYGGRLVENVTQAVARDVLAAALVRLEDAGLPVIGHVHDEILVEGSHLDQVTKIMVEPSPWMQGLPMAAEGDVVPRYRKI